MGLGHVMGLRRTSGVGISVAGLGLSLLPVALVGAVSAPAGAVISGNVLSGTASPMWQTNNEVDALATSGGVIYAGGRFTRVRPPGTSAGSAQEVARTYLAAFNGTTGALVTGFNVTINGRVRGLSVSPDGSRLYVVGSFTSVNGTARNRVAALNLPSGTLVTSFNPNANSAVMTVDSTASTVYLGGDFTTIRGTARRNLAAVDTATGALITAFAPVLTPPPPTPTVTPTSRVNTIEVTPDGSRVLAGGSFRFVGGVQTGGIASLDPSNGALQPWPASDVQPINTNCLGRTTKILASDDTVYVTAEGDPPGCYEGTYAADAVSGDMKWNSECLGASQGLALLNGVLYKGSHQHDCAFTPGGAHGGYVGGTSRDTFLHRYLVGQDVTDGTFVHWSPNTNAAGTTSIGPHVMASDGTQVIVGGDFTRVNNVAQQGLARFRAGGDTATPETPGLSYLGDPWPNTVRKIVMRLPVTVQPTAAGTLTVQVPAVHDNDTGTLVYRVYRDNGANPVATLSTESWHWSRPVLRFDDTGLAPGSTHSYRVSASDGTRTSARSATVSATVAAAAPDPFASVSGGLAPVVWWRLGDAGPAAADSSASAAHPGTFEGGLTPQTPGAVNDDTGVTLDGASGYVAGSAPLSLTGAFSQSAWFKTSTLRGGVIMAQSDRPTGPGGNTDRILTMDNNGNIVFAMKAGPSGRFGPGTINIRNQGPVWNDGRWHHVVGTYDGNGNANLYVDGWLQGSATGTPFDPTLTANGIDPSYVRAGYADMSGIQLVFGINFYNNKWPLSEYLDGSIDEVAVYPTALTLQQVQALYAAGVAQGG